jgi:hypothetical protein
MVATTWGGVWRSCQAASGRGRVRVWCWPPLSLMWAVIALSRRMVMSRVRILGTGVSWP